MIVAMMTVVLMTSLIKFFYPLFWFASKLQDFGSSNLFRVYVIKFYESMLKFNTKHVTSYTT